MLERLPRGAVTSASDETFLARLGVHRIPVAIPFLEAGGPVNVCFIENGDGTYTLFDSGLGTADAEASLRLAAKERGLPLDRVSRILVSHGHIDHYGLAELVARESGAKVYVHQADWAKVVGPLDRDTQVRHFAEYFHRLGVAPDDAEVMLSFSPLDFAHRVDPSRAEPWAEGQRFTFAHFEAEALHMPGHTPGMMNLWSPSTGLYFAADHILARISPNPLIDLGDRGEETKFPALATYLKSARRACELDIQWVIPGHGPAFQGHRALLTSLFEFYQKRQQRLAERLELGEATALDLVRLLFGRADPLRLFLMLSEVVGNLEVMEADGRVARQHAPGGFRFRLVR